MTDYDPATVETSSLTSEQIAKVKQRARETAEEFVDEFGDQVDPSESDWDAEAWEADRIRALGPEPVEGSVGAAAWRLYQATLVTETRRLAAGQA